MAGAGPVILDNETANSLEQPKSREEVSSKRDIGLSILTLTSYGSLSQLKAQAQALNQ